METGQTSSSQADSRPQIWARLVPNDSSCSEIGLSIDESSVGCGGRYWGEVMRNADGTSATFRNVSSNAISVDGTSVGEGESVNIRSRSTIISEADSNDNLSFTFEVIEKPSTRNLQIFFDIENAKCSICLNIWHDVVTVCPCLHNFCNGCFSEWLRKSSSQCQDGHGRIACPQCRANVHSVARNHFLHNIEQAILDSFSSLKRSDEEIAMLDTCASIKPNLVLDICKKGSRKRPLSFSTTGNHEVDILCSQCGMEICGFRCNQSTTHLSCQCCGGMMPSRPDIEIPQRCLGCDRSFCGAYWSAQGVDIATICSSETFKPISEYRVTRIPESVHQNNRYEKDITERCIQQMGKTLQTVIADYILKFDNNEIDRSRLQLNCKEAISSRTHLCNDCYNKLVGFLLYWFRSSLPRHLLPPDAASREDCWYGHTCRTQHHNHDHARKRNHVCRSTRGNMDAPL